MTVLAWEKFQFYTGDKKQKHWDDQYCNNDSDFRAKSKSLRLKIYFLNLELIMWKIIRTL